MIMYHFCYYEYRLKSELAGSMRQGSIGPPRLAWRVTAVRPLMLVNCTLVTSYLVRTP